MRWSLRLALGWLFLAPPALAEELEEEVTFEEEVDLGVLEAQAPPAERPRTPWLLLLPAAGVGLLFWNTQRSRSS